MLNGQIVRGAVTVHGEEPSSELDTMATIDAPEDESQALFSPSSRQDWDSRRQILEQLYTVDKLEVQEIISVMKDLHGFSATKRQYLRVFKRWGIEKTVKGKEYKAMVRIQARRRALGKKTVFKVRRNIVSEAKIARFEKRDAAKNEGGDGPSTGSSPVPTTSPSITYFTPPPSPILSNSSSKAIAPPRRLPSPSSSSLRKAAPPGRRSPPKVLAHSPSSLPFRLASPPPAGAAGAAAGISPSSTLPAAGSSPNLPLRPVLPMPQSPKSPTAFRVAEQMFWATRALTDSSLADPIAWRAENLSPTDYAALHRIGNTIHSGLGTISTWASSSSSSSSASASSSSSRERCAEGFQLVGAGLGMLRPLLERKPDPRIVAQMFGMYLGVTMHPVCDELKTAIYRFGMNMMRIRLGDNHPSTVIALNLARDARWVTPEGILRAFEYVLSGVEARFGQRSYDAVVHRTDYLFLCATFRVVPAAHAHAHVHAQGQAQGQTRAQQPTGGLVGAGGSGGGSSNSASAAASSEPLQAYLAWLQSADGDSSSSSSSPETAAASVHYVRSALANMYARMDDGWEARRRLLELLGSAGPGENVEALLFHLGRTALALRCYDEAVGYLSTAARSSEKTNRITAYSMLEAAYAGMGNAEAAAGARAETRRLVGEVESEVR